MRYISMSFWYRIFWWICSCWSWHSCFWEREYCSRGSWRHRWPEEQGRWWSWCPASDTVLHIYCRCSHWTQRWSWSVCGALREAGWRSGCSAWASSICTGCCLRTESSWSVPAGLWGSGSHRSWWQVWSPGSWSSYLHTADWWNQDASTKLSWHRREKLLSAGHCLTQGIFWQIRYPANRCPWSRRQTPWEGGSKNTRRNIK